MVHMHQNWLNMFGDMHPWAPSHPVVMSIQRRPQPSPKEMNSRCCLHDVYEKDSAETSLWFPQADGGNCQQTQYSV